MFCGFLVIKNSVFGKNLMKIDKFQSSLLNLSVKIVSKTHFEIKLDKFLLWLFLSNQNLILKFYHNKAFFDQNLSQKVLSDQNSTSSFFH
jgi:hypothetical protein